jgi:hypothetical protein
MAAYQAVTGSWPRAQVRRAALLSNGVSCLVGLYAVMDWTELMDSLGVVTREVVNAADGWPAAEGGVGSVMVVPMDPGLQGTVAGGI